jgi:hypothetical protein
MEEVYQMNPGAKRERYLLGLELDCYVSSLINPAHFGGASAQKCAENKADKVTC